MTSAKAIPLDDMVGCRDGCAAWLARSLGLESFRNPASAAIGLLLGGGLSHKHAEVARVLVWLDQALPIERHVEEHERGDSLPLYIRLGKVANWYEVETAPPTDEDIQTHRDVAACESALNEALRQLVHQVTALDDPLARYCEAGQRLDESITRRVRNGCIVRALSSARSELDSGEGARAADDALRNWTNPCSRWGAMMIIHAAVYGNLSAYRELAQLRRPFIVSEAHPFESLILPSTFDEWRTARRVLEKALFDVGFIDAEIGKILPDGTGDARRRVAARRKRMTTQKTSD